MNQVVITRATNRRALLIFMAVLTGVVLAAASTVLVLQRQHLRSGAHEELRAEMALLGELATDALLRSDYATVEGLVQRWATRHDNIVQMSAVMPNGFVLANVRKRPTADDPLLVKQEVLHNQRSFLTLQATSDFALIESGFTAILVRVSLVSMVLILLLGWLLWWTLQRTALQPLANEIGRREDKERELLQRTADLESALQELESFSYSVSHDLRGPLRAIDGFSHALIEDYGAVLDANGRDYIARTRAASQRMGLIIDDMLALARMTRREMTQDECDLSVLARDILARFASAEPGRNVLTEVTGGMRVRGDASLLAIALENLLSNAWKYTSGTEAARIEFGSRQEEGETIYYVRDNGAGFNMAFADKLFRPFQRLHTMQEYPGSGIGLATVQRIIHRHGGRVWAEGQVGKGATFFFTLVGVTGSMPPHIK